jgi:hypothetical protein
MLVHIGTFALGNFFLLVPKIDVMLAVHEAVDVKIFLDVQCLFDFPITPDSIK